MSKYKFVKIKDKHSDNNGTWFFKPQDMNQVLEHWNRYGKGAIAEGMKEVCDNMLRKSQGKFEEHYTTHFGNLVDLTAEIKFKPHFEVAVELENEILHNRLKDLDKIDVYLSDGLTQFSFIESLHDIVDEVELDYIKFPQDWDIKNVRYCKWYNGEHWYAKINNIDIVDEQGNQKWDTKEEAISAAERYIEKHK